jgi:hypothetical protein
MWKQIANLQGVRAPRHYYLLAQFFSGGADKVVDFKKNLNGIATRIKSTLSFLFLTLFVPIFLGSVRKVLSQAPHSAGQ